MKVANKLLLIVFSVFIAGCEKQESNLDKLDVQCAKLYEDTLASGENSNIKISAGNDRLYMTYGWGSAFYSYVNGITFFGSTELTGTLLSTDMNGNMQWK